MNRRSLLLLAAPALLRGADAIVGRWRSVTTTKGGIGAVYEFGVNGRTKYSSAALLDMEYQVEGPYLKLAGQTIGMGWHPDGRLQLNYGKDQVEDYSRRGKAMDTARHLLGEWTGTRVMAGRALPAAYLFGEGNKALHVLLLKTLGGQWKAAGQGWSLTVDALPPRTIAHDAATGRLTITVAGGDPHEFSRF